MINWITLAANSLWILGCALALSTFSYVSWQASLFDESLRERLSKPGAQIALSAAGLLFAAGQAILANLLWQSILWGGLGVLLVLRLVLLILEYRKLTP